MTQPRTPTENASDANASRDDLPSSQDAVIDPPHVVGRLNHVALVVPDLAAACTTWREALGATLSAPQPLPEHGVTVVFVELPNTRIELLEPLGDDSPVSRFLERHAGGGMHHVCLEVEDILAAREALLARGARVLGDGEPRIGAHGNPVLFLHPADLHGTLIELEEVESGSDA